MANENPRAIAVYNRLRDDILEGLLPPNERLRTAALCSRFEVSMSVVREALTRLAAQGLVAATPRSGFRVAALSVDDLKDITQVRVRIEGMALRDSIEKGDLSWEQAVVSSHHALSRTPMPGVAEDGGHAWRQIHREFHYTLLSGCGSPRLLSIADSLGDSAELYRAWSRTLAHLTDRDVDQEHRQIMEHALARDADAAAEALREHIERTTRSLLKYASAHEADSGRQNAGKRVREPNIESGTD